MSVQTQIENERREERRRNRELRIKRNQERISVVGITLTVSVMMCMAMCFILIDRPEMSKTENRMLATFPDFSAGALFSGNYAADIDTWYTDTLPGRETFKDYVAKVRGLFGGISDDGVRLHGTIPTKRNKKETEPAAESYKEMTAEEAKTLAVTTRIVTEKRVTETAAAAKTAEMVSVKAIDKIEAETELPTVDINFVAEGAVVLDPSLFVPKKKKPQRNAVLDDPNVNGEVSNNILVYQNRGIMLFGGTFANGEKYAEYVNNYKYDLPDVNVYSMVCPTPVSYYLPSKYEDMTESEKDTIAHINKYLKDVTPVDALEALDYHTDEKIFQNTDHHWTHLGAFYAADEFAKVAKVPFADMSEYEKRTEQGYVGTLYGFTGDSALNVPEEFTYYTPKADYTTEIYDPDMTNQRDGHLVLNIDDIERGSWYCVFIGRDDCVTHVNTKVRNGRKLAVVKDSYGNALIPWLTSSFEDIYVVDMRYFDVNAVEQFTKWRITDLLFAMNTFSATGDNFENIERIRTHIPISGVNNDDVGSKAFQFGIFKDPVLPELVVLRLAELTLYPHIKQEKLCDFYYVVRSRTQQKSYLFLKTCSAVGHKKSAELLFVFHYISAVKGIG